MDDNSAEIIGYSWRDNLTNLLGVMSAVVVMFAALIVVEKAKDAASEPPGNLIVHIVWPTGDTDIDLWVDGPGEPVPVGYSNKSGKLWSLLRDDLGNTVDSTPFNFEDSFTRGIVAGTYYINVMCYHCPSVPQAVDVEVSVNNGEQGKSSLKVLVSTKVKLTKAGQERTAISFKLKADGTIEPGSMNSVFKPLREAKK